jgi:anaerobic selenocysteine-containing dehydrogenase
MQAETLSEAGPQTLKSTCRGCHGGCGVLLTVEQGTVTHVEGDPEHPLKSRGIKPTTRSAAGCKGFAPSPGRRASP